MLSRDVSARSEMKPAGIDKLRSCCNIDGNRFLRRKSRSVIGEHRSGYHDQTIRTPLTDRSEYSAKSFAARTSQD